LRVETGIGGWHDSPAEAARYVQSRPARLGHPERSLGVLAYAPLVPASDADEGAATEQAHRADEGHRVALVTGGHDREVEALVGVDTGRVVDAALVVAVALEGLQEAEMGIGEVRDGLAQVVRLHDVVGVDQAD